MNQILKGAAGFLTALALILGLGYAILTYLDMPVIGFDSDGNCVWVEVIGENGIQRKECPLDNVLPDKYEHVYVWHDDSKGNQYD